MQIAIVGLGSILMGDDGVGPYCLQVLEGRYEFPDGVQLLELGTPGPEFGHILLDWDRLIVLDSVKAAGEPGDIRLYTREEILAHAAVQRLSPHDPSLRDALLTADFVGEGPADVRLIGVIPARVEMGTELSPEVQAAVPKACAKVLEILAEWGIEPTARADASTHVWWSRGGE
jgi:hydrogenase maturation protease